MNALPTSAFILTIATGVAFGQQQIPDPPPPSLEGTWTYNSFLVNVDDPQGPSLKHWSPTGELTVTTSEDGKFKAELIFTVEDGAGGTTRIPLDVTGEITPAAGKNPAGFAATGVVRGPGGAPTPFVNRLKGWFVPAGPGSSETVVRGAITNAGPDVPSSNSQPPYTVGTFVLKPKAAAKVEQ